MGVILILFCMSIFQGYSQSISLNDDSDVSEEMVAEGLDLGDSIKLLKNNANKWEKSIKNKRLSNKFKKQKMKYSKKIKVEELEINILLYIDKKLPRAERLKLFQTNVGEYILFTFRKRKKLYNDMIDLVRGDEIEKFKELLLENADFFKIQYETYISRVINEKGELNLKSLTKYHKNILENYIMSIATRYELERDNLILVNLYRAIYLLFMRYEYNHVLYTSMMNGFEYKNIVNTFLLKKLFDFTTLKKISILLNNNSNPLYGLSISHMREFEPRYKKYLYENIDDLEKDMTIYFNSDNFSITKILDGKKQILINRIFYTYFNNDHQKMFDFIRSYNASIDLEAIKDENYMEISDKVLWNKSSINIVSNRKN